MRSFFFFYTHTHQRTQLTIVTNIIEREFVATAIIILYFHFLRCWGFYAPIMHHETEGVIFEQRTTYGPTHHNKVYVPCLMMY